MTVSHLKKKDQLILIAHIDQSIVIQHLERIKISTKFFIDPHYFFFLKKVFINTLCVMHIDNKNQIQVIVINVYSKKIIINPFDQLVIIDCRIPKKIKCKESSLLSHSKRGNHCFGSTGI
ncbi:dUTP diphosphatase [Blattabacterium cuenoti]|uniref:dUTP diphosphatase n=1 Tax=Blattabacterium cuenoti TaxID=1653831 RepID=UPI00163BA23F|nr:dUTP diphosphatase [Blattabacterium cuenoti]